MTDGPPGRLNFGEVTIDPFTRSVDISDAPVGDEFLLNFVWRAAAVSITAQGTVYWNFVDPLDFTGGFTFDDTGLTASPHREDFETVTAVTAPASAWLMATVILFAAFARRRGRPPSDPQRSKSTDRRALDLD
ncbi:MAG: hypothetical protein AAF360_00285 [Pseudomonadota bacterium]